MPEISIIIPVYNVENKIRRCLDSITQQSFSDFECILVDDGSLDNSGELCDLYSEQDKRFRVIHQENMGVSKARNVGLLKAQGKYVAFVDSDDYVDREYIAILHEKMKPDIQLVICGIFYCNDINDNRSFQPDNGDYYVGIDFEFSDKLASLIEDRRLNYVYGKLFSTDIIRKNNIEFNEDVSLGEDTIFVMDYIKCAKAIYVIGQAYYYYIKYSKDSLTTVFHPNIYKKYTQVNNYIENCFETLSLGSDSLYRTLAKRRVDSFYWAIDFLRHSELTLKKKEEIIGTILHTPELQEALKKHPELISQSKELKIIRTMNGRGLLRYYELLGVEEKIVSSFKALVVKLLPKKIIIGVKRWLTIVRS